MCINNCRTVRRKEKLKKLRTISEEIDRDIRVVDLSEARRNGERLMDIGENINMYYSENVL